MADNDAPDVVAPLDSTPAPSEPGAPAQAVVVGKPSKRPTTLLVIVLLAGGAAAYTGWSLWANREIPGQKVALLCVSPGCGFRQSRVLQVGEELPIECPQCKNKSLHSTWQCPKCGTENVMNQTPALPGPPKCSKCKTEFPHGQ
jgi:hypothetical protein